MSSGVTIRPASISTAPSRYAPPGSTTDATATRTRRRWTRSAPRTSPKSTPRQSNEAAHRSVRARGSVCKPLSIEPLRIHALGSCGRSWSVDDFENESAAPKRSQISAILEIGLDRRRSGDIPETLAQVRRSLRRSLASGPFSQPIIAGKRVNRHRLARAPVASAAYRESEAGCHASGFYVAPVRDVRRDCLTSLRLKRRHCRFHRFGRDARHSACPRSPTSPPRLRRGRCPRCRRRRDAARRSRGSSRPACPGRPDGPKPCSRHWTSAARNATQQPRRLLDGIGMLGFIEPRQGEETQSPCPENDSALPRLHPATPVVSLHARQYGGLLRGHPRTVANISDSRARGRKANRRATRGARIKGEQRDGPLRYSINVTPDGCCHHEAGLPPDEESMRYWTAEMERADALLFGRVTY